MLRALRIGSDGRGGHEARLEVGTGPLAGASIKVAVRQGRVTTEISRAPADATRLAARLAEALRARGLDVDEIEVM